MLEDRFEALEARLEEMTLASADPDILRDVERWQKLQQEISRLAPPVAAWHEYLALKRQTEDARALLHDPDMAQIAQEELHRLLPLEEEKRNALRLYLLPRDPNDDRNVIMEIRPGAGGDEAALFAALLLRMYQRYAERKGYAFEPVDITETELGGVKEAVFSLSGVGAFSRMKFESGVHRIQRVPVTESGGRIHTSTATVAVLPEMEEVDVTVRAEDLRIDTYRASGHGGQYINRTDSAVRITHLPTGLVVTCQDEKSQLKNKEKAMKVLSSRLYALLQSEKDAAYAENRRSQVGSGERNERIRTYNFPQGRVTDHRANLTLYRVDSFVDGDMDEVIDALLAQEQTRKLLELSV